MSKIKLNAASGGGSVSVEAPTSTTGNANVELKLPIADGSNGQALTTNGSGQLAFSDVSGTTINNNADDRIITGSGTANTLNAESNLTLDSSGNLSFTKSHDSSYPIQLLKWSNDSTTTNGFYIAQHSDRNGRIWHQQGLDIDFGTSDTQRFRIHSNGQASFGTTSNGYGLTVINTSVQSNPTCFFKAEGFDNVEVLRLQNDRANSSSGVIASMMLFYNGSGAKVGSIEGGTTTAYNTTSDYRLKENVVSISDGITRLKTLKPKRFNFIESPTVTVDGFLAHEVTAVPEAISGEKDAMARTFYTEEDTIPEGKKVGDFKEYSKTEIDPQGLDQSKLVPLLTAALQEAIAKIEVLETKVAALEAA